MEQRVLQVPDMHCGGCQSRIEQAVGSLDGVRRVKADFQTGRVEVAYDGATADEQAIRSLIEHIGFQVR
jgi:copper chaperone CopZ